MVVMAVVRVAVLIRNNLSICILCGGISGVDSGGGFNSCCCGLSLVHNHNHNHHHNHNHNHYHN